MAITPTGSVTNNIAVNGDYLVGDGGNGGLTVDGGSVFSVTTPNAANEPLLAFGQTAGATGTGTITGAGSKIVLSSLGGTSAPGGVNIGRTGNGTVVITAGGALVVEDLVGTTFNESNFNGGEFMNIGRNAGGQAIQTQSFYDVGGSGITNFDPDNLYAYSSYTTYYDSLGRADQTNGTYDATNGSFYVNFDQEDIYAWTSLTVIYDQFGTVTQQWYTMPDGSIVYL
jgi:hypothetical protein